VLCYQYNIRYEDSSDNSGSDEKDDEDKNMEDVLDFKLDMACSSEENRKIATLEDKEGYLPLHIIIDIKTSKCPLFVRKLLFANPDAIHAKIHGVSPLEHKTSEIKYVAKQCLCRFHD